MSEIHTTILYGSPEKAAHDRMIEDRGALLGDSGLLGARYTIAYATSPAGQGDRLPEVMVCDQPVFNVDGDLVAPKWRVGEEDDLRKAVVIDRWSENYLQPEGPNGIGLEPEQVINPHTLQRYGADKMLTFTDILQPLGLGIETYLSTDPDLDDHLEGNPIIMKPRAGALGEGIVCFDSVQAMLRDVTPSDDLIVQPFMDFTGVLPGLDMYTSNDPDQLLLQNVEGRTKELRMYTFLSQKNDGRPLIKASPIMRVALPGQHTISNRSQYIRLNPLQENPPMMNIAQVTGAKLQEQSCAPFGFVTVDVGLARTPDGAVLKAIECNTRLPRLRKDVIEPREYFVGVVASALENLQRSQLSLNDRIAAIRTKYRNTHPQAPGYF